MRSRATHSRDTPATDATSSASGATYASPAASAALPSPPPAAPPSPSPPSCSSPPPARKIAATAARAVIARARKSFKVAMSASDASSACAGPPKTFAASAAGKGARVPAPLLRLKLTAVARMACVPLAVPIAATKVAASFASVAATLRFHRRS